MSKYNPHKFNLEDSYDLDIVDGYCIMLDDLGERFSPIHVIVLLLLAETGLFTAETLDEKMTS